MAQTRDLIVRGSTGDTKSYIRIGDETPMSVNETSSTIQFLQNLQDSTKNFDTAGTTSAFRIRHDTVNGALIFQGRSGSYGPFRLMTLNDDSNTVTFGGVVNFQDITFDQITGSNLYIRTGSRFDGNITVTGSKVISFSGSMGTASIRYNSLTNKIQIAGVGGNSWKTQYMITGSYLSSSIYSIYTTSTSQIIQHYPYLSVYCNGSLLIQSASNKTHWDYKDGGDSSSIQFRYNLPYSSQDQFYLSYVYNGGSD